MVSAQTVYDQLKHINVNAYAWGRTEISELPNILLPDEEIFECVNGYYDAGFALLVATNVRVLLVDKKPLSYLTVEDMRFDMINEIDYSHRLIGAQISISAGSKLLIFRSYNKPRLRKLINHVQHSMAEVKKMHQMQQEGQNQNLQSINQQLQLYLLAQQGHERELTRRLFEAQAKAGYKLGIDATIPVESASPHDVELWQQLSKAAQDEIFSRALVTPPAPATATTLDSHGNVQFDPNRTAYSRVPLKMRNRYFGRTATGNAVE